MKKFLLTLAGATALSAVLIGCNDDKSAKPTTSEKTAEASAVSSLKIGLINQEKEQVSYPELSAAARAAVKYINAELKGVGGRPLSLDVCAAGDSAESAVACANRFANQADVPFVINATYNSAAVNNVLLGKKAMFTFNASLADATTENLYTLDPGVLVPVKVMFDAAIEKKVKSVSVLITDDPETKEAVMPLLEMVAKQNGIKVVNVVPVGGSIDMTAAVTAAQPDNVDALIMVLTNADQCIPVGQSLIALGVNKLVYSSETCAKTQIVASGAVNGWYFQISSDGALSEATPGPDTLKFRDIIKRYSEGEPDFGGTAGFAVTQIMAVKSLYEHVGVDNITPDSLNQALKAGWSNKPLTAPEIQCPGKAPFIGQCQTSMYLAQAKDGSLGLARPAAQTVDLTAFSAIISQ
jgi:branched-chain amino acid transport system substrate-binding protein